MNNNNFEARAWKAARNVAVLAALFSATPANALVLSDSMTFLTANQSMWGAGGTSTLNASTFLGTKWGTYAGQPVVNTSIGGITGSVDACIGIDTDFGCVGGRGDTRTGAVAGIKTSGQIGIVAYAQGSGGAIDISVPVQATLSIPDGITSGNYFTISTTGGTKSGASIFAKAPSFKAGIDGVFDVNNNLYGKACFFLAGCAEDSVDLNIHAGQFQIIGFDTSKTNPLRAFGLGVPGVTFGKLYNIHAPTPDNPDGVDDPVTPKKAPTPIIGHVQINKLSDKSGGKLDGNSVSLKTNQNVLELSMSVTGVIETLLGSPGYLANEVTIVDGPGPADIKAGYVLADVSVGPILGMQQQFKLDPHLAVKLEFDRPVTAMERQVVGQYTQTVCDFSFAGICLFSHDEVVDVYGMVPVSHADGIVTVALGDDLSLMFDDEVGRLVNRTYFLDNPYFSNSTSATIDPAIRIRLLCASLTLVGELCAYDETFQTTALAALPVFSKGWGIGGFNDNVIAGIYDLASPTIVDPPGGGGNGSVPEPATLVLLLIGFASMLAFQAGRKIRRTTPPSRLERTAVPLS